MLSIQKILVLIAIIWIVWTLFRLFDRRNKNLKDKNINLVKCAECGMWIDGKKCKNVNCSKDL